MSPPIPTPPATRSAPVVALVAADVLLTAAIPPIVNAPPNVGDVVHCGTAPSLNNTELLGPIDKLVKLSVAPE